MSFKKQGDVVPWIAHPDYNTESGIVSNLDPNIATVAQETALGHFVKGDPVSGYEFAAVADVASISGLIFTDVPIEALADGEALSKVCILARGPAIVNFDQLPTKDVYDTDWVADTLKARLVALGFALRYEGHEEE